LVRLCGGAIGLDLPPEERAAIRPDLVSANEKSKWRGRRQRPDADPTGQDGQDGQDGQERADGQDGSPVGNDSGRPEVSKELLEIFLNACENPDHRELG
jgi:hypothetical protein